MSTKCKAFIYYIFNSISGKTHISKSKDLQTVNTHPHPTNTSDPNLPIPGLNNQIESSATLTTTAGAIDEIDNPFTTPATPVPPSTPRRVTFDLPPDPISDHQLSDSPWLNSPSDAHNTQPHMPISPENILGVFKTPQSRKSLWNYGTHHLTNQNITLPQIHLPGHLILVCTVLKSPIVLQSQDQPEIVKDKWCCSIFQWGGDEKVVYFLQVSDNSPSYGQSECLPT